MSVTALNNDKQTEDLFIINHGSDFNTDGAAVDISFKGDDYNNGSATVTYEDGTVKTVSYVNGHQTGSVTVKTDGTVVTENPAGTQTTIVTGTNEDGSTKTSTYDVGGSVTHKKDGTEEHVVVTDSKGQKVSDITTTTEVIPAKEPETVVTPTTTTPVETKNDTTSEVTGDVGVQDSSKEKTVTTIKYENHETGETIDKTIVNNGNDEYTTSKTVTSEDGEVTVTEKTAVTPEDGITYRSVTEKIDDGTKTTVTEKIEGGSKTTVTEKDGTVVQVEKCRIDSSEKTEYSRVSIYSPSDPSSKIDYISENDELASVVYESAYTNIDSLAKSLKNEKSFVSV